MPFFPSFLLLVKSLDNRKLNTNSSMPAVPRHFDVLCGMFTSDVTLRMPLANACCCHRAGF